MRLLDPAICAQLAARNGLNARLLAFITARDRSTGDPVSIGFWTGEDHQTFVINGDARTYYGAGTLLSMPPLQSEVGLRVRSHRIVFSPLAPEVQQAIRGYDPRLAPTELHVAYFDLQSQALIADPVRVFKGFIDTVKIVTPPVGGSAEVQVDLMSSAHALTRVLALKKSHESLIARAPTDQFRSYTSVTGAVTCVWGEKKARPG
jgi:hypothetical protein